MSAPVARVSCVAAMWLVTACGAPSTPGVDAGPDVAVDVGFDVLDAEAASVAPDGSDGRGFEVPVVVYDAGVSNIRHVVMISQENHTFDAYFGSYCTAPSGTLPACETGPGCCERAPAADPMGVVPMSLDDAQNGRYDPPHGKGCETLEMNGGRMDRFGRGAVPCSDPRNVAVAPAAVMSVYHGYAQRWAMSDRYFQPIIGATSANDMYFAVARKEFDDNSFGPAGTPGVRCQGFTQTTSYDHPTIAHLLLDAGVSFTFYAEGLAVSRAAGDACPAAPPDCPAGSRSYPCTFDPSDVPFLYYPRIRDDVNAIKDFTAFAADLDAGRLPAVAFIKPLGYRTEHPGGGTTITAGEQFVDAVVQRILASPYAQDTLILVSWDEGGGYFDHVTPPPASPVDGERYGTRIPFLVLGRFARRNHVSHVTLEHSSIVRFLEWNFLHATGLLHARDGIVNNLGSLLDPAETGVPVPSE